MNARRFLIVPVALLLLVSAVACGGGDDDGGDGGFAFGLSAQTLASGGSADAVSAIVPAPDGRIFYAEQFKGTIQIILADGTLQPTPFTQVSVAEWLALDWGLTGLALDPDFADNHYVYAFYTEPAGTENNGSADVPIGKPVIVRFTEEDGAATDRTVIVDDLPLTDVNKPGYNANGDIHFGPDGMLYASIGDYDLFSESPEVITGLGTPIGKMLRLNPDGSAADDNPFAGELGADPRVYAVGFRDPFSFDFAPDGTIYANDNTTINCEEINIIEAGESYGWPEYPEAAEGQHGFPFPDCTAAPGEQAITHLVREGKNPGDFLSFVEVSGLSYLTGSTYSGLTDGLIVCEGQKSLVDNTVSNGVLRRLTFSDARTVLASDVIVKECKGDALAHNGVVYYSTDSELKKLIQSGDAPAEAGDDDDIDDGGEQQTPPNLGEPTQ